MSPKTWYEKGLRFQCTQCGNCCRNHGDYSRVYLSERDIVAISEFLGLGRREFLREHCLEEDGWTVLRLGEPRCQFLNDENGCTIYPVRPKQCMTWPFWTENLERATWTGPVSDCCPGIGSGPLHSKEEVERSALETDTWYANG